MRPTHPDPLRGLGLRAAPCGVSLYIHVPFCTGKCCYCDFFSLADRAPRTIAGVVGETLRQAETLYELLGSPPIPTVFIGGGSPSSIPRDALRDLLFGVARIVRRSEGTGGSVAEFEWTVEANPESLDRDLLSLFAESGVTRVSLGVQSFDDDILASMGRRTGSRSALRACELLADSWNGEASIDLIAGFPGRDARGTEEDVRRALTFAPGHLSLYSLILEEGTRLQADVEAGRVRLPAEEEAERAWLGGRNVLLDAGYDHYEISNFALPGKECRHNLRYWKMDPYLGCGPSAVSTLPGGEGPVRLTVPKDIPRFLAGKAAGWGIERETIGSDDLLLEQLMMGLRLRDGIERERIRAVFGADPEELVPGTAAKHRRDIRETGDTFSLTDRGRLHLDALLRDAIGEIADRENPPVCRWPWCSSSS